MSFYSGTQTELLYAMPASATAVTAATITPLSASSTTNPAYQLPTYFFPNSGGISKSLLLKGGGWFTTGTTAVTTVFTVGLDTAAGTLATTIGKTGTVTTLASVTDGAFVFEVQLTATGVGSAGTINAVGNVSFGAANNAVTETWGTFGSAAGTFFNSAMICAPQTPVSYNNSTGYFIELFNTWSATTGAPTITLTNFTIFGLN